MGGKNSGKAVGGSTVHYAMVSLRFRPEWFKARSKLGYGADWPIAWREMWHYYAEAERQIGIAGPISYPWGPKRPRYPYRAHELNEAAKLLAKGCEALGIGWTETPLATVSAPHARRRAVVALHVSRLLPLRLLDQRQAIGADGVDPARARRRRGDPRPGDGRADRDRAGRAATGVHYHRDGAWRFQRARNVVVAGYAVETPRLLLNSANDALSATAWPTAPAWSART